MEHSFNVEIAEEYGIPSAIILHQICRVILDNEQNGTPKWNGKTWACQSAASIANKIPYMSVHAIRRTLTDMVNSGLLEKAKMAPSGMDHSAWYSLTDKSESAIAQIREIDCAKSLNRCDENAKSNSQKREIAETLTGQGFEHTSTSDEDAETEEPRVYIYNKDIVSDKDIDTDKYNDKNTDKNSIVRKEILEYLNRKAGTKYRDGALAKKHINARLNEGYTVEDFKTVIDSKCAEWLRTDMAKYLRPETLFGTKMDGYLGQAGMKARTVGPNGIAMDPDLLEDEELRIIFGG